MTLSDHLRQAAEDIIHLLTHPPTSTVPSLQAGYPVRQALTDLATQLQRIEPIPSPVPTPHPTQSPTNAVVPPHEEVADSWGGVRAPSEVARRLCAMVLGLFPREGEPPHLYPFQR